MTACWCGVGFDPRLNYEGKPRSVGPVRRFCSLRCAKQRQNKDCQYARRSQLRRLYGMTLEQYGELSAAQSHQCAICGSPETTVAHDGRTWSLAVDHNHATGQVRGLLCTPCNRGIGFLRDDADLLRKAISYLEGS